MSQIIPLQAVPSQGPIQVVLNGQSCQLNVYQKAQVGGSPRVYLDLQCNGYWVQQGKLCLNNVLIVRHAYLGFMGDLVFLDTQGATDPRYTGFNPNQSQARYLLLYLYPSELPEGLS